MTTKQIVWRVIGAVFGILALVWLVQGNEFFLYKVFGPAQEQVRRETFEETKSYNDGMAQQIYTMQMEYVKATPDQKDALASVILHRVAGYDQSRFPPDLQAFLNQVKRDQVAP